VLLAERIQQLLADYAAIISPEALPFDDAVPAAPTLTVVALVAPLRAGAVEGAVERRHKRFAAASAFTFEAGPIIPRITRNVSAKVSLEAVHADRGQCPASPHLRHHGIAHLAGGKRLATGPAAVW
jgi:hypothetical protein